jgi:hypothetical protein
MDLREMGWKVVDWMLLAQSRDQRWAVVSSVKETSGSIKGGKLLTE